MSSQRKFTFTISSPDEFLVSECERELTFTFAKCHCPSVCRLQCVMLVRPTQAVEIFRNVSMLFGTLATH